MKKECLLLTMGAIISLYTIAQSKPDLKPFKVDLSWGLAIPGGSGSKGGFLSVVEPKYTVLNNLALGFRLEVAVLDRFYGFDVNGTPRAEMLKASASYLATADYYFSHKYSFRPFVGAGTGIYSSTSVESTSNSFNIINSHKFGEMIRAGIEISHFRVGIEYNIVPSTSFDGFGSNGNPFTIVSRNSYIGFKLGIGLGGGPKR